MSPAGFHGRELREVFFIYIWDSFDLEVKEKKKKSLLGLNNSRTTQIVPWNLDIKDVILKQNIFFNWKPFISLTFDTVLLAKLSRN